MKQARKITLTLGAIVLGWFAWEIWRRVEARTVVVRSLPTPPDLRPWPSELQARVTRAQAEAHGYWRPGAALVDLSRLYHANGFFDEAIRSYDGLQRWQSREPRWPHLAASILAGRGELDRALPLFRQAVALDRGDLPARLRIADILLKSNQTAEAALAYTAVFPKSPENPYALLGLARCAIATGEWEKAREYARRSIAAHSNFAAGLSMGATVAEHFGDEAETKALRARASTTEFVDVTDPWLEAVLDDCYDSYRLSVAAAVAIARGDFSLAERWLQRAIDYSPQPATFHRQLGNLYVKSKNDAAARQHLQDATRLEPTDSDAWAFLVSLLNSSGDRAAAYRAVTTGLASCPDSRALHYAYGHMLTEDSRFPQAMVELRAAKRLQPNEANAYVDLALIHFQLGEIDNGVAEMTAALKVQPDHPLALTLLTRRAIDVGDERSAAALFRRIRQQSRIPASDIEALVQSYQQRFNRAPL